MPQADITYVIGDATEPVSRPAIILHSCNDVGAWGAGFVLALSRKWAQPEQTYRQMKHELGQQAICQVEPDIFVINAILQHGVDERRYTSILHMEDCLMVINDNLLRNWPLGEIPSIHMPRIGCGLGRLTWDQVYWAVYYGLEGQKVFVYDLTQEDAAKHEIKKKRTKR